MDVCEVDARMQGQRAEESARAHARARAIVMNAPAPPRLGPRWCVFSGFKSGIVRDDSSKAYTVPRVANTYLKII